MFFSDCIVLKLCIVFLKITLAKQAMLFDFHNIGNMAFKNVWLEVENKKRLSTQNLQLHELKFSVKKAFFYNHKIFYVYPRLYYTGNMLFAMLKMI